jgi:hypothetical protein
VRAPQAWYGPDVMSTQMVRRWCQQFPDERTSVFDDVRPHKAVAAANHIATCGWERLDHAPYSPDLTPRGFHFFLTLKTTLEGRRFTTNEDAKAAVRTQDTDFYQQGFFMLVKRWTCVGGDCVENKQTSAPFRPHWCASRPYRFLQMVGKGNLFSNCPSYFSVSRS